MSLMTPWEPMRKFDPFREMEEMTQRFNRMFGRPLMPAHEEQEAMQLAEWSPVVDISETPEAFRVRAELPGIQRKDVHVTLENGVLMIQGERKREMEEKDEKFHRIERMYGAFVRRFTLPVSVDPKKVEAKVDNGILTLFQPKEPNGKAKATEIKIK